MRAQTGLPLTFQALRTLAELLLQLRALKFQVGLTQYLASLTTQAGLP